MKNIFLGTLAAVSLAACATPPLEMTAAPQAVQLRADAPMSRIRTDGQTPTTVRAFQAVTAADGSVTRTEIAGATCSLTSDHFVGNIVTPQVVQLPKYNQDADLDNRGVPPSVVVNCTSGALKGQGLIAAKPGQIVSGSGNLVADIFLIAGSAAIAAAADWRYVPAVNVDLQ